MTPAEKRAEKRADEKEAFDNRQRAEAARLNLEEARALVRRGRQDLAASLCLHTARLYERIGDKLLAKKARAMAREIARG